jgi:hypothetical protein
MRIIILLLLAIIVTIGTSAAPIVTTVMVYAQFATPTTTTEEEATSPSTFQSDVDGIRISSLPEGWIVEDIDNTDQQQRYAERVLGFNFLAKACPADTAIPTIGGGGYKCSQVTTVDSVTIVRFSDLMSRPEFEELEATGQAITISDMVAFYVQYVSEKIGLTGLGIQESEEREVNIVDPVTGEPTGEVAQARWIMIAFDNQDIGLFEPDDAVDAAMVVLGPDGNTGYALMPTGMMSVDGGLTSDLEEVYDSFELLAGGETAPPTNTTTTTAAL